VQHDQPAPLVAADLSKLTGDRWYRIVGHREQHNPARQSLHG
jgi:hypothetical protein